MEYGVNITTIPHGLARPIAQIGLFTSLQVYQAKTAISDIRMIDKQDVSKIQPVQRAQASALFVAHAAFYLLRLRVVNNRPTCK